MPLFFDLLHRAIIIYTPSATGYRKTFGKLKHIDMATLMETFNDTFLEIEPAVNWHRQATPGIFYSYQGNALFPIYSFKLNFILVIIGH